MSFNYLKENVEDCDRKKGDIWKELIEKYKDQCRQMDMSDEKVIEIMDKKFYHSFDHQKTMPNEEQIAMQRMMDKFMEYYLSKKD